MSNHYPNCDSDQCFYFFYEFKFIFLLAVINLKISFLTLNRLPVSRVTRGGKGELPMIHES